MKEDLQEKIATVLQLLNDDELDISSAAAGLALYIENNYSCKSTKKEVA
ncbi:hypothetical protein GGQ84_002149 [Desulfitispora alkaliphila]